MRTTRKLGKHTLLLSGSTMTSRWLSLSAAITLLGGPLTTLAAAQDAPAPVPTPSPTPVSSPSPAGSAAPARTTSKKGKSQQKPENVDTGAQKVIERPKGTAEKLFGPLFRDITLTGSASTRFQQNAVNGTSDGTQRFSDQNVNNWDYRNVGPFQNNVDMTVQGRLFNAFSVNARLSNSRNGNYLNQAFAFDYHNRDNTTKLNLGNVNATLPGNQFVTFTRSVQGVRIERIGKIKSAHRVPSRANPTPGAVSLSGFTPLVPPFWAADDLTIDTVQTDLVYKPVQTSAPATPVAPTERRPEESQTNPFGFPATSARQSTYSTSAITAGRGGGAYGTTPFSTNGAGQQSGTGQLSDAAFASSMGFGAIESKTLISNGGWSLRSQGIASLTRAITRRGSFRGTGSAGPYFLNAGSLVEGSEKVQVNGTELRAEEDYRVDYLLGQISFLNGRIINAEDTVTFTYEAQNFNTTPGILTGYRFDIADPGGNSHGITFLQQKAIGQRIRNGNLTERFPVFPDSSYRYTLTSVIDTAFPVEIRWYNRVLVEGVDYILNRDLRYFQLITTALPPDNAATYNGNPSLSVTYRPVRQNALAGDRSVLGLDTNLRVGKNAMLKMEMGQSSGLTDQQNGRAIALQTTWNGAGKNNNNAWQWTAGVKQVGETFSSVDSTASAFLQPERNFSTGIRFSPNPAYLFSTSLTQGSVANRGYTTTAANNTLVWAKNQSWDLRAGINLPKAPTINFAHQQTEQQSGGSRNVLATSSLDAAYRATSQLNLTAGVSRTSTRGRSVFAAAYNNSVTSNGTNGTTIIDQLQDSSGSQTITNSTADTARIAATYSPLTWLSLASNVGFSRSHSRSSASNSRSTGLSITASPIQPLSLSLSVTDTSNGQSTAGFYNPGLTGGSTIIPTGASGQRSRATAFSLQYSPSARLSGQFSVNQTLSLVPGYDNTKSGGYDWTLTTTPRHLWQMGLTGSEQSVTYVGGQGNSKNRALTFNVGAGPFGRVKFDGALTRMNFGSASYLTTSSGTGTPGSRATTLPLGTRVYTTNTGYFQQGNNLSWSLNGDYALGARYSLIGRWQFLDQAAPASGSQSSVNRAGTNFWQGQGSIGFDFRITEIMGFGVNFNYVNLHDRDDARYSYRARMLTADLSAHF